VFGRELYMISFFMLYGTLCVRSPLLEPAVFEDLGLCRNNLISEKFKECLENVNCFLSMLFTSHYNLQCVTKYISINTLLQIYCSNL